MTTKRYRVYTFPAGQSPARFVCAFSTKRAAKRFMRRERYLQIIVTPKEQSK